MLVFVSMSAALSRFCAVSCASPPHHLPLFLSLLLFVSFLPHTCSCASSVTCCHSMHTHRTYCTHTQKHTSTHTHTHTHTYTHARTHPLSLSHTHTHTSTHHTHALTRTNTHIHTYISQDSLAIVWQPTWAKSAFWNGSKAVCECRASCRGGLRR